MKIADFEICVDNLADAIEAAECGAARLELCADLSLDGLSPSDELLDQVLAAVSIPVMVMVRPRAGGFAYNDTEIEEMAAEILRRRSLAIMGFVFGCLGTDNMPDPAANRRLLQAADGLPCTFHRAFEQCPRPLVAIDLLHDWGFQRILTSGDTPTAWESKATLRKWMQYAGERIQILPAGKVRAEHARQLQRYLDCDELHSSAIRIACDVATANEAVD